MRIFVMGGSGLVGQILIAESHSAGHEVRGTFHTGDGGADIRLDKRNQDATRDAIRESDPDAVIDTAAFHSVDDCETERDKAWSVNAQGTRNVAKAADEANAHYVYLSTDYVFPGNPDEAPYSESDPVDPVNYYARTKLAGEQAAYIADRAIVLRPSVIYGSASGNFATWALGELEAGNEIDIVDDQISTPTYAPDLAAACVEIVESGLTGLYHSTGPERLSRYEFTRTMADVFGYDPDLISPISSEEFGQDAERPMDSSLDSSRLYDELNTAFSTPREGFEDMRSNQS